MLGTMLVLEYNGNHSDKVPALLGHTRSRKIVFQSWKGTSEDLKVIAFQGV